MDKAWEARLVDAVDVLSGRKNEIGNAKDEGVKDGDEGEGIAFFLRQKDEGDDGDGDSEVVVVA